MKAIFPLLLCYVLMTSQTYAISGGPVFGGNSGSVVGTYSGTLQGTTETQNPGTAFATTINSNALGLFTLGVPASGNAAGGFLLFSRGNVYPGTVFATVDPRGGRVTGIVQGSFQFSYTPPQTNPLVVPQTINVTAQAAGSLNATVTNSNNTARAGRMRGTATLQVNNGFVNSATLQTIIDQEISFTVLGFRQTTAAPTGVTPL